MHVLIAADVHLRHADVLGRPVLPIGMQWMGDLLKYAQTNGIRDVVIAGDLLDQKAGMPLEVYLQVYRFLQTAKIECGVTFHILRGNHESPSRSEPEKSLLTVFRHVASVHTSPSVVRFGALAVYLLPWYPAEEFIRHAEEMAAHAYVSKIEKRLLVAHVGLKEGFTSSSNIQIPQRVTLAHLHPELYGLVLLGDYHAHQQIGPNTFYLGAPHQHTFGDERCHGAWLLDTDTLELDSVVLQNTPPAFRQWRIEGEGDLNLPGYKQTDFNRILAPLALFERLNIRYPGADLRPTESPATLPDVSGSRVSKEDVSNPARLIDRYLELRQVPDEEAKVLRTLMNALVGEAQKCQ